MTRVNQDMETSELYDRVFDYIQKEIVEKVEGLRLGDYSNGTGHPPFMTIFLGGSKFDSLGEPTDNPYCYHFEFPESFKNNPSIALDILLDLNQIMSRGKKLIDMLSYLGQEATDFRMRVHSFEGKGYNPLEVDIRDGRLRVPYEIPIKTEEGIKKVLRDFLVY